MKKILFLLTATAMLFTFSCKQKKVEKDPVQVVEVKKDTIPEVKPAPKPKPLIKIDEGVNLTDKYFVVVGSYTVEDFAKERLLYFKKKGLKPALTMRNEDGWFRLAVKSFKKIADANKALKKLKKDDADFANAWVMTK